jgi:hypothetical protein
MDAPLVIGLMTLTLSVGTDETLADVSAVVILLCVCFVVYFIM